MVKKEKNLLPKMFFDKLNNELNGNNFQWFYNSTSLNSVAYPFKENNDVLFTHLLWRAGHGGMSDWYNVFEPILYFIDEKVKFNRLLRMKLNLYVNQNKEISQASHHDVMDKDESNKPLTGVNVAVLNFTTCNGGTKIGSKFYSSNANEILIFDNTIEHNGTVQTDKPVRIVLNINWE